MSMVEDAMAFVDEDAIAQLTMEMVDIPSPQGGEKALAEYLADRFRAAGLVTWMQEVEPERYNVYGRLEGTGDGPTLMYCGHLDTTYGGDEEGIRDLGPGYQPKSWREDEWIYGMGTYNMKSGHASAILAVEAMARSKAKLRGNLMIAGVVGETCHRAGGALPGGPLSGLRNRRPLHGQQRHHRRHGGHTGADIQPDFGGNGRIRVLRTHDPGQPGRHLQSRRLHGADQARRRRHREDAERHTRS